MFISCSFSQLVAVVVILIIFSPTLVYGDGVCTCRRGKRAFSDNSKVFQTARQACRNAGSKCFQDNCRGGMICKKKPKCGFREASPVFIVDNLGRRYSCGVTCRGGKKKCKRKPGGRGDPHISGFDGSSFDFHGEGGKYYAMFGRSNGDFLVTRMRSTHRKSVKNGIEVTYFDEFGLKIKDSPHRIGVSLVNDGGKPGEWRSQVKVDERVIERTVDLGYVRIILESSPKEEIHIITADTEYSVRPELVTKSSRRHLDLDLKLRRSPRQSEKYLGLLGFTLNKVLGHDVHPDLKVSSREGTKLEFSLRKRFEVGSLFPSHSEDSLSMAGVVRMTHSGFADIPRALHARVKSFEA